MIARPHDEFVEATFRPVGPAIRQRREALGLSQEELAQRLGFDTRMRDIERIESGTILFPSWIRLLRIASALDCSAEDLMMGLETSEARP